MANFIEDFFEAVAEGLESFFFEISHFTKSIGLKHLKILCITLFLLLLFSVFINIITFRKKTPNHDVGQDSIEYMILDYKMNLLEKSKNIFRALEIDSIEQLQQTELFKKINQNIKDRKALIFQNEKKYMYISVSFLEKQIKIGVSLNFQHILNNLPIPLSMDFGFCNIINQSYRNFGSLKSTEFFVKGQFFSSDDVIYKRETLNSTTFLFPVLKVQEFNEINQKLYDLPPLAMCILNRNGDIVKKSQLFSEIFNSENIANFSDILEFQRNYILHNAVFFADLKKRFAGIISKLTDIHEETFGTVDGKVIMFQFIENNNKIFFFLQDITKLSVSKSQEYLIKDLKEKILPKTSDFIIFSNSDGVIENSNCELIQKGERLNTARTILKFFTNQENQILEINLSNNGKCLFLKNSIKEKIHKTRDYISSYLEKIVKILYLLNDTIDGSLSEYLKYIKFITINIENKVKTLEFSSEKNFKSENFNIISETKQLKQTLESSLDFKNLNVSIPDKDITIHNNKNSIMLVIETMFLICFKYQFNQKNMIFEEKGDKFHITLDGISKEETETIYNMFDLISQVNIVSNIKEIGEKISISITFNKTNALSNNVSV